MGTCRDEGGREYKGVVIIVDDDDDDDNEEDDENEEDDSEGDVCNCDVIKEEACISEVGGGKS